MNGDGGAPVLGDAIAIIGMAGRFPGASDIAQFWRNLCDGVESIARFEANELEDYFDDAVRNAPNFVRARPLLDHVDQFDAGFFGMHRREAELTDPQQRIFLECAWEALEDGGCDPARYAGAIGVFAGSSMNTYFLNNVCAERSTIEEFTSNYQVGSYPMLLGSAQDFLSTRVSYKLDLKGPSLTLQSACSTSLAAVIQACQSLLLYQSDLALAGGVSVTFPQKRGYLHQDGGMVSSDGHCRPFDADASGTIFGSGAGVVLLKRLDEARADGDHIYAVIRGSGLNNDGTSKVGFTAPSADGQAAAIEMALASADVSASSISYVECHGTATPLGDPIELAGLTQAYRTSTQACGFCAVGSVKSNIGHLDVAAGVAGLIKTALALEHRTLPASLHYARPNPQIDFSTTPFFVNAERREWPAGETPRRAGVSAFGVGGTNAHVILEEPPRLATSRPAPDASPGLPGLIVLSAQTDTALSQARARLASHLQTHPELDFSDVCATLQSGRRAWRHRSCVVARDASSALARLLSTDPQDCPSAAIGEQSASLSFMLPGQGSQHPQMGRVLYDSEPVFRAAIDRCAAILQPLLNLSLTELLYPAANDPQSNPRLQATALAQPAVFAVEYALAQLWMSWGVQPQALIGHSVGEFVAATLAGVFALDDALGVVAARGALMQALPPGLMLSVRLSAARLQELELLGAGLTIAAINGPTHCVVAGRHADIETLEHELDLQGAPYRRLHTSHAFHSPVMDAVIEPLRTHLCRIELRAPKIPYVSCVSGDWIRDEQACSIDYWARHAREPVLFGAAVARLAEDRTGVLLEVGPGAALSALARSAASEHHCTVITSLPDAGQDTDEGDCIVGALGRLWLNGVDIDWPATRHAPARTVSLPTYAFDRSRYWIDAPAHRSTARAHDNAAAHATAHATASAPHANLTQDPPTMNDVASAPRADQAASSTSQAEQHYRGQVVELLETLSGESLASVDPRISFLEMGFDSLFLTQVSQRLQSQFKQKISFRQLLGDFSSISKLAALLAERLPLPSRSTAVGEIARTDANARDSVAPSTRALPNTATAPNGTIGIETGASGIEAIMRDQLQTLSQLIDRQLDTLRGLGRTTVNSGPIMLTPASHIVSPMSDRAGLAVEQAIDTAPARIQVYSPARKSVGESGLDDLQRRHLAALTARYCARTAGSKQYTETYRSVLADPRAAAGFRTEWKEMVYPIVCVRALGSKLWDLDGNEYIDLVNGYGQTAFGHNPPFVAEALAEQARLGFAIGPQTPHAGRVAQLFSELTGNERVTFCNTGSEAVMAALRLARSVTGRDRVVMFSGAYHGQFDEVLVKGLRSADGTPRPAAVATGIPASAVGNMVVLEYGSQSALEWIAAHAEELAAVIVEPVQSRHPALLPLAFLRELRRITAASGTALVMDEVVTGFRVHPGGMQAVTGVRADLATYGKVVGGGLPIGVLAGRACFMDALDGGRWNYGDDSFPEVGVTFFAGTFVRHPLAMAATWAVLNHVKQQGAALQDVLSQRCASLVQSLQRVFELHCLSARIECYASLFYFSLQDGNPLASLLYYELRSRGLHIQEGFPCFLTTAHSDADIAAIVRAFDESLDALQAAGILSSALAPNSLSATQADANAHADAHAHAASPSLAIALTESQLEIWLAAQLGDEASCAFNESVSLRLTGQLDRLALQNALNDLLARHDALRTTFSPTGETLRVAAALRVDCPIIDLSGLTSNAAEQAVASSIASDACSPFDLVAGPLFRASLLQRSDAEHVLLLTAHHIVCDGWSINLMLGELAQLYAARLSSETPDLPAALSFSQYAQDQRLQSPAREAAQAYWLQQFARPPAPLDLPADRARSTVKSFSGATRRYDIEPALLLAVKQAGARQGCTLFATLLGAFEVLMGRLADRNEVTVGVPTAGQSLLDDALLVGHCVNFLPIRAAWETQTTLAEHLHATRRAVMDAFEHQDFTLGTLVRKLALPRRPDRVPLAEIQFNLERLAEGLTMRGLDVVVSPNPKAYVNFDLFMNVIESAQGLRIDCEYNSDLFDASTIDRWLLGYRALLEAVVADIAQPLALVSLLPQAALLQQLQEFNATARPYPSTQPVQQLFEAQVAHRPQEIAAIFGEQVLTYLELERRANRLANHLRDRLPAAGAGARVAIALRRSSEMLVALLATLKAGFAYVPIDPTHPASRLQHIFDDAAVVAIISDAQASESLPTTDVPLIRLDDEASQIAKRADTIPEVARNSDDLAYVIYTSGTTGKPKGVAIRHRSVVNLLTAMAQRPGLHAEDAFLAVTTLSFDIAALELLLPLTVGARVVIADEDTVRDGFRLSHLIEAQGITAMQATPSGWQLLLEAGFVAPKGFKMLVGGEALSRDLANRLMSSGAELWNMYGPTETTIWSSCGKLSPGTDVISVGRPIANTSFYVLDRHGQPTPLGMPGELYIGGDGVALGYHGNTELTHQRFVENRFASGRLYRSGDAARWLDNGELQILGRLDQQIKLRGYRIEPGEIETLLLEHPDVTSAVVVLHEEASGAARLAAYVVARPGTVIDIDEMRSSVSAQVPEYMVPTAWMQLDAFPLTLNGKLDRLALPAPDALRPVVSRYRAPSTPTELQLAQIWAEVLQLDQVGCDDDLFDLGADSIHIFQIVARAHRAEIKLSAKQLMRSRTIAAVATCVDAAAAVLAAGIESEATDSAAMRA